MYLIISIASFSLFPDKIEFGLSFLSFSHFASSSGVKIFNSFDIVFGSHIHDKKS